MNNKLIITLLMMTFLPLAIIAWLGVSRFQDQRMVVKHQEASLLEKKFEVLIERFKNDKLKMTNYLDEILDLSNFENYIYELKQLRKTDSYVLMGFWLNKKGELEYPKISKKNGIKFLTKEEVQFVTRTQMLFDGKAILPQSDPVEENFSVRSRGSQLKKNKHSLISLSKIQTHGWIPWYWEDGLHLLFWKKVGNEILGVEMDMVAIKSQLIASLPEKSDDNGLYVLTNSQGQKQYQWGRDQEIIGKALGFINLSFPMETWKIQYFNNQSYLQGGDSGELYMQALIIIVLLIAILGLAFFFYKESTRDIKESEQRVQMVNRVSHELKTPLTNIRLYAELLQNNLPEDSPKAENQLKVIQSETQRLSRLIHNILTFSKQKKSEFKIRTKDLIIDDVVNNTLESFLPSLEKLNFKIAKSLNAKNVIHVDPDAGGQILSNLISNVEKYGRKGRYLGISTLQSNLETVVIVKDKGPGLPITAEKKVFENYYRVKNEVNEGVSGTGIGLTISRELARLHGGDLKLINSDKGCEFHWTIPHKKELS